MGSSYKEEVNKYKLEKNSPFDDCGMPHMKKKKKTNKRSKHKHEYIPAVYHHSYTGFNSDKKKEYTMCGSHCKHCGRIKDITFMWFNSEDRIERFKKEYPDYVEIHLPENWDCFRDKNVPV